MKTYRLFTPTGMVFDASVFGVAALSLVLFLIVKTAPVFGIVAASILLFFAGLSIFLKLYFRIVVNKENGVIKVVGFKKETINLEDLVEIFIAEPKAFGYGTQICFKLNSGNIVSSTIILSFNSQKSKFYASKIAEQIVNYIKGEQNEEGA